MFPDLKQFNDCIYILSDGIGNIVGEGDSLTLQNCFGFIDIKNPPQDEEQQDAKMAALAFDMDCQLFKRIDTNFINPKNES